MKITIYKYIIRYRKPYIIPARYSSETWYKIYEDEKQVSNLCISVFDGSFNKMMKAIKNKYGDIVTYEIDNKNTPVIYQ